jgi:AraC family transcriptional regulator
VAAAVRLSPSYFSHAFKESFGQSAKSYIIERRIARAKHLMLTTRDTLAHIALACGFSDQAHFCRPSAGWSARRPAAGAADARNARPILPPWRPEQDPPRPLVPAPPRPRFESP